MATVSRLTPIAGSNVVTRRFGSNTQREIVPLIAPIGAGLFAVPNRRRRVANGRVSRMALRKARLRPGRRVFSPTAGAACVALLAALGGCNPIDAYRSAVGIDKNDPNPATAPFRNNMRAAEAEPYPNLASVPPPPTRETTTAERQKLTQSLLADRAATQADAGPAPPVPAAVAKRVPAAAAAMPAAAASISGHRKAEAALSPQPLESNLQTPQIPSVPQPEAPRPAPPPPVLPAIASPALVAEPASAAIASAMPQPAPPVPELAPIAAPPPPAAVTAAPGGVPDAATIATLPPPGASGTPGDAERAQIARVAALYKQRPGNLRIIAYAATPNAGGDPLAGYHLALDRAQRVATALSKAGVPAGNIQTEAAPATGAHAAGRLDIQRMP